MTIKPNDPNTPMSQDELDCALNVALKNKKCSAESIVDLIERGANPNYRLTIEALDIIEDYPIILTHQLSEHPPNMRRSDEELASITAALLRKGANPAVRNDKKKTAMQMCIKGNLPLCIQAFIDHGVSFNMNSKAGLWSEPSEFLLAMEERHGEIAKQLWDANKGDDQKVNADKAGAFLFQAISGGDQMLPFVSYLIKEGADLNQRDAMDDTVLHRAIRSYAPKIVEALLSAGAPLEPNRNGTMPLALASQNKDEFPNKGMMIAVLEAAQFQKDLLKECDRAKTPKKQSLRV